MRTWLTLFAAACLVAAGAGAWGWNHYVAGTWTSSTVVVQVAPDLDAPRRLDALEEAWEGTPGERVLRHILWRGWACRLKAGQYTFPPEESVQTSAQRLATGDRDAVDVVVPSGRDVGPVAGAVSRRVFADSAAVAASGENPGLEVQAVRQAGAGTSTAARRCRGRAEMRPSHTYAHVQTHIGMCIGID